MITVTMQFDNWEEARLYSNALEYHHLLQDFAQAMRSAKKHGSDEDVLRIVDQFLPDMYTALDNHLGAY